MPEHDILGIRCMSILNSMVLSGVAKIGTDRPFRSADLYCLLDVTRTYGV